MSVENSPNTLRIFICELLRGVRSTIVERFGTTGPLVFKYGQEAITEVDRQIEDRLVKAILERFPDHRIVGEEGGVRGNEDSSWTWQIDPIDGTLNYSVGIPVFSTSVAVLHEGVLQAGGVLDSLRDELFSAGRGEGSWTSRRPFGQDEYVEERLQVSSRRTFAEAVVSTQFGRRSVFVDHPDLLQLMMRTPLKTRRLGSIAIELAWLAAGRIDLLLAGKVSPIHEYDIAAGVILVEEAGGKVTDGRGGVVKEGCRELIVSNGHMHEELVEFLKPWLGEGT